MWQRDGNAIRWSAVSDAIRENGKAVRHERHKENHRVRSSVRGRSGSGPMAIRPHLQRGNVNEQQK